MAEESTKELTGKETSVQEAKDAAAANAETAEAAANAHETAEAEDNEDQDNGDAENEGLDASEKTGKKPRQGKGNGKPYRYNRSSRTVYHQPENPDPSCRVYVGNLAWEVTWMDLKDHMKQGGCEVTRADILATPDGRSKGCGIVEFASAEGAQRALLLNDTELKGRQIFVREDRESGGGGGYFAQKPSAGVTKGRASGGEKQSCRVYVGNLSWEVAWQDLKDHMRGAGEVVYAEVMTEPDGRSKGCGIVEYSTPEEAKKACETLNDTELQGRMIFVREDRETASSGGVGAGGRPQQRGGYRGGTSVYVGNLAYETSWQDLKDHMRQAGNVDQANIMKQDDGRSKGCGIVVYQNPRDAARAIRELQNSELHGRPIFVREDREQGGAKRGGGGFQRASGGGAAADSSAGGVAKSGCQLFVGNLSFDTTWKELKDHFRQCGEVERVEVMEGPGGRKKGFGTVRFFDAKDAKNAIERLDGVELQGRELKVRLDEKAA
mmetsp:Transcript_17379/g.32961  ORF Transcript_17379/g.32961 Transcript_17379/m.32961 type:complete len:494 (+) Transcript_17379:96-1577(+)